MRINRKVKIDGKWVMAAVPLDRAGRPDAKFVLYKGNKVAVDGGTFYIASGRGANRTHAACGDDPAAVRRALNTQAHVLEVRRAGLEVGDAPEIMERRKGGKSLREIARSFAAEPPSALTKKSISKYENALRTFAAWAATVNIFEVDQVKDKTIGRWVAHQQKQGLDARTLVTKTRMSPASKVAGRRSFSLRRATGGDLRNLARWTLRSSASIAQARSRAGTHAPRPGCCRRRCAA